MFTVAESQLILLMKTPGVAVYNRQQETETLGRFCETLVGHNVLQMPLNDVAVTVLCHSSGAPNDQIFHIVRRIE